MKPLGYLLGAGALAVARDHEPVRTVPEPDLPPIATTTETAAAWRRWAEVARADAARAAAAGTARPDQVAGGQAASARKPA